jgi:putative sporulation protein YyaC
LVGYKIINCNTPTESGGYVAHAESRPHVIPTESMIHITSTESGGHAVPTGSRTHVIPTESGGYAAPADSGIHVIGTLEKPVHARNVVRVHENISHEYDNPLIVAIDASLGTPDKVGCVSISGSPLYPGAGVNKVIGPIGHMHITGIVNMGGFMNLLALQCTRLGLVMKMADFIAWAIIEIAPSIETLLSVGSRCKSRKQIIRYCL